MQKTISFLCLFSVWLGLVACSAESESEKEAADEVAGLSSDAYETLTVYKTESCGCCNDWIEHVRQNGISVDVVNQDSVAHIKDLYGVPQNARSCHTAISESGKVFEGHVPAKWIKSFLRAGDESSSHHSATAFKGLVVPAMPLGSPGMEYKDQFNPYTIYHLSQSGELLPYQSVGSYEEQF